LASLRCVPNLTISSPIDEHELRNLMYTAQLHPVGPFVIRYPRGSGYLTNWRNPMVELPIGKGECLKTGKDLAILSIGPVGKTAFQVAEKLETEGLSVAMYNLRFVKPLDEALLHEIGAHFAHVITIENGTIVGGFGSAILEFFSEHSYTTTVRRLGIPDHFIEHGSLSDLHHLCGFDAEGIEKAIREVLTD
jgi:1-deoxy-D-xylulose-5-phosphate synthase